MAKCFSVILEKILLFFFISSRHLIEKKKMTPVNTFVCANRYLRAWVLVCMYVRTCVSVKADLYVQL